MGAEDNRSPPAQDIADAAHVDPLNRIATVSELTTRLQTLDVRRKKKRQDDMAAAESLKTQEALTRVSLRRPWVVLTITSLAFGLLVTLWSVHRALLNRDDARRRNATLEAMYSFLAIDLLGQSNPYLKVVAPGNAAQQTLVSAIATAIPQIDGRFLHQPDIAGRLHETIADSLKSRMRYREADGEYSLAAQRFRSAKGQLSQQAIRVELKRKVANLAFALPGATQAAKEGFQQQVALIAQIHPQTAELQAWETGLIGMSSQPENSLPLLNVAVKRAEATPNFDPQLLVRLKNQYCGTYVRMGDGPNLERASREMIGLLTKLYGEGKINFTAMPETSEMRPTNVPAMSRSRGLHSYNGTLPPHSSMSPVWRPISGVRTRILMNVRRFRPPRQHWGRRFP